MLSLVGLLRTDKAARLRLPEDVDIEARRSASFFRRSICRNASHVTQQGQRGGSPQCLLPHGTFVTPAPHWRTNTLSVKVFPVFVPEKLMTGSVLAAVLKVLPLTVAPVTL